MGGCRSQSCRGCLCALLRACGSRLIARSGTTAHFDRHHLQAHLLAMSLTGLFLRVLLSTPKHLFESVKSAKSNYLSLHHIKIDIKHQNPPLKDSVLKMPLRKLSFSAYVISQNEALINKNNYYGTLLFMSKTSQSAKKSSSNLQKMKICPKSDICPFCNKAFN